MVNHNLKWARLRTGAVARENWVWFAFTTHLEGACGRLGAGSDWARRLKSVLTSSSGLYHHSLQSGGKHSLEPWPEDHVHG